jgi:ABC-type transport system involved in cytochrome c biogenesis permease subunit
MNTRARSGWAALVMLLAAAAALPSSAARAATSAPRWSESTLELAAGLPVQEGGRVKPLATLARYTLMALNGRASVKLDDDAKLGALEWLLDVLLRPEVAADYRMFLIQDDAVLDVIGLAHEGRGRRDRYSFRELEPRFEELERRWVEYRQIDPKQRTRVQGQVLDLYQNVRRYVELVAGMQFATVGVPRPENAFLEKLLGPAKEVPLSAVMARVPELFGALPPGEKAPEDLTSDQTAVARLLWEARRASGGEGGLAVLPPAPSERRNADAPWANPLALWDVREGRAPAPETLAILAAFERVGATIERPREAEEAWRSLHALVVGEARARGQYDHAELEVDYLAFDPVGKGFVLFLIGLALAALALLSLPARPRAALHWLALGTLGAALLVLVGGIVARCVIQQRPPVKTLYEVVLFVTATSVIVAFVIEWLNRRRVALLVGAALGTFGLLVAQWYEALDRQDTMPTLQAVLDSNFWLSTHVTTVTLGYGAGLLAAAVAHVHVLGRVLGLAKGNDAFYAGLARTTYGVICFGLVFSVVGTILGGVWANDSWGRFWGWDPKENGALMICLWELMFLHARMGGLLGIFGQALMAVVGGVIVVFSLWQVNLLGVGLHSYGFTEGIQDKLNLVYAVEAAVLASGAGWWLLQRRSAQPA